MDNLSNMYKTDLSLNYKQAIEQYHPIESKEDWPLKLLNILLPNQSIASKHLVISSSKQAAILLVENFERKIKKGEVNLTGLKEACHNLLECSLCETEQAAVQHTPLKLIKELSKGSYDSRSITDYLTLALRLTIVQLKGSSSLIEENVQNLYQKVLKSNYGIQKRSSYGHSPSYFLIDPITTKPFAILKQSHPEFTSSYSQHLPKMPLNATVWEHELVGFEEDQLFGFDHTPVTLSVRFLNQENVSLKGSIQEYIPDSKAGFDFYNPSGAELLKAIPKSHVHSVALSGMFKGLAAAHMSNYILQVAKVENQEFITSIYDIDLEEMMLPYNRLSLKESVVFIDKIDALIAQLRQNPQEGQDSEIEKLEQKKKLALQSLILCRLWVLGLPQCGLSFDRAALMMMTHPSFLHLLEQYQNQASQYCDIEKEAWNAQLERVKMMQELCIHELTKDAISLSPRSLYFAMFGGKHLWELAQEKRYPAIIAFNNLVSDPCQHILKDFSDPYSISVCERLDKPKEETAEGRKLTNFLRIMEGLEPI